MKPLLTYLETAKISFHKLLIVEEEDDYSSEMEVFLNALMASENFNSQDLEEGCFAYRKLFIEVFQFSVMIDHDIWSHIPKLHSQIGKVIESNLEYEDVFRSEVVKRGFGKKLIFVE